MMKKKIGMILSMLALPFTLLGQSTLNFPRAFTPADLTATGFAVVNPGPTDASVTFRLLSASGVTVSAWSQLIRARGQIARLGSEYFQNAATAGWVQATSTTSGLQGFWIGGDFSTFVDGAEGAVPATDQILPLVAAQTELNIANPGVSAITVTIRLLGTLGQAAASTITRDIPALGVFQSQASAIFPGANLAQPTHIRITSTGSAFVATSVVTGLLAPRDTGVVNGVDASSTALEMNFPHVVSGPLGGLNYSTVVGITNLAATAATLTVSFTPEGSGVATSVQRNLEANGTLRETVQALFNFLDFRNGWIKVTSTAAVTGYVAYAETTVGGFAVVPAQAAPRTSLLFLQVADLHPWSTGIALLNTTTTTANVEVFAVYPDGTLIGGPSTASTASFSLSRGTKIAKLLPELVGASVNGGFVFVRTTNNVPLYGLELFFSRSGSFLGNVAAGSLMPGIIYTPPIAADPTAPVLSSISPPRTTRNTTVTLTGSNFAVSQTNNVVEFKTVAGTVDVPALTATATNLTVVVPSAAISGPVVVKVNGRRTAGVVLQITASATALDQNTVRVFDGQTSSGIDIYVPPPVGPALNATQAAAVEVEAGNFTFTSSADLPRGQTKDLAISGTGMTQANGSAISFSGDGLTISNVRYQTNGATTIIIVRIAVDANAEVGPRNIGIKNSNLDQTIFSGGVFIR